MSVFNINDFWREVLPLKRGFNFTPILGWSYNIEKDICFIEAPISISEEFDSVSMPNDSDVLLISAPGAVGKTTLAKQISCETGSIYIDLAEADPVGGNSITGGLVKSGVLNAWQNNDLSLLIDGLDEARLKVTQESFEAFLGDIASLAVGSSRPIVIFGRTGAIQDAWLHLAEQVKVSVLEIGYYDSSLAINFAISRLKNKINNENHYNSRINLLRKIIEKLREDTIGDGIRFSGYAPVIKAIADFVASDPNPASTISKIDKGEQAITLPAILESIIDREKDKLKSINFDDKALSGILYNKDEQFRHLLSLVYDVVPPSPPSMSPADAQRYSNALKTWVVEHPFLDGNRKPASAVFEAAIVAEALKFNQTSGGAVLKELAKGAAANPFITEFYFQKKDTGLDLPPEHIGVIYASVRARLAQGDSASLHFEGFDDEENEDDRLGAEVEITTFRAGEESPSIKRFVSTQIGRVRLGSHVQDVSLSALFADVDLGGGREVVLVTPISIQCHKLNILAERVIVDSNASHVGSVAFLEADIGEVAQVVSSPIINGEAKLVVVWEGSERYPWSAVTGSRAEREDPNEKEALRRFRKFVISFRSHSKGSLKRFADKLDHDRMTKGVGIDVLNKMIEYKIITKSGPMYTLDPDALAREAGADYPSTMAQEYSKKTVDFLMGRL